MQGGRNRKPPGPARCDGTGPLPFFFWAGGRRLAREGLPRRLISVDPPFRWPVDGADHTQPHGKPERDAKERLGIHRQRPTRPHRHHLSRWPTARLCWPTRQSFARRAFGPGRRMEVPFVQRTGMPKDSSAFSKHALPTKAGPDLRRGVSADQASALHRQQNFPLGGMIEPRMHRRGDRTMRMKFAKPQAACAADVIWKRIVTGHFARGNIL